MKPEWATPETIAEAVRRKWASGKLLAALHSDATDQGTLFPLRVRLPGPDRTELSEDFATASAWAKTLQQAAKANGWELLTRPLRVPGLGVQHVPNAGVVHTGDVALALLTRAERADAQTFAAAIDETRENPTIANAARTVALQRPLDVVAAGDNWPLLLAAAEWVFQHPRPNVYIREIPVAGMHTKVVETNRNLFGHLLAATTDPELVPGDAKNMEEKFGFKVARRRVRIRGPREVLGLPGGLGDADVTWPLPEIAALMPPASITEVVVVENQTSFLVIPENSSRLVIWGAGYGADELVRSLPWVSSVRLRYWGDIDTHGYAILDAVRRSAAHAESVLMDVDTLTAHRAYCVTEAKQSTRELAELTPDERRVYEGLRAGVWGPRLRLEQELIRFDLVQAVFTQT